MENNTQKMEILLSKIIIDVRKHHDNVLTERLARFYGDGLKLLRKLSKQPLSSYTRNDDGSFEKPPDEDNSSYFSTNVCLKKKKSCIQ